MTNRAKKIVIPLVVIAVCVLFFLSALTGLAIMGHRAATRAGNEAAAIQELKTIAALEIQYFNNKRTFATVDELISEQLLSARFAGHPSVVYGYVFNLSVVRKADGTSSYKITADPQDQSQGKNHFYLDSDNDQIHVNSKRQAGPDDRLA